MEILITSTLAFISTNIDDIFLLSLFYTDKNFGHRQIIIGQLLGTAVLTTASLIGAMLGLFIGAPYIGVLGLFPIYLGAKALLRQDDDETSESITVGRHNIVAIFAVTVANGGDNVGIYIPLFATLTWIDRSIMIAVFFLMTILWCLLAKYITKHPYVSKRIDRYGSVLTPIVLIVLGIYILFESGLISLDL